MFTAFPILSSSITSSPSGVFCLALSTQSPLYSGFLDPPHLALLVRARGVGQGAVESLQSVKVMQGPEWP